MIRNSILKRESLFYGIVLLFISCNANVRENELSTDSALTIEEMRSRAQESFQVDSLPPLIIMEPIDTVDDGSWEPDYILIDKGRMTLKVYDTRGVIRMKFPIGVGINPGNKKRKGDHRTPEGEFKVIAIQPSSGWTHNFNDGKGVIKGCYGPWFIRLRTPVSDHIGIHGTHLPETIGSRCTEGCVRLHNEDVAKLKEKTKVGMLVKIVPGEEDNEVNEAESGKAG